MYVQFGWYTNLTSAAQKCESHNAMVKNAKVQSESKITATKGAERRKDIISFQSLKIAMSDLLGCFERTLGILTIDELSKDILTGESFTSCLVLSKISKVDTAIWKSWKSRFRRLSRDFLEIVLNSSEDVARQLLLRKTDVHKWMNECKQVRKSAEDASRLGRSWSTNKNEIKKSKRIGWNT